MLGLILAAGLSVSQIHAIDAAANAAITQRHVPSVVVMVDRDGKRVFEKAYGLRNVADKLPANVDTKYQYGSITKQFTAMGIFLLAQDGKLNLTDDIGKWFPKFANRGITVENLLIHTSGIPDLINDGGDEFMKTMAALPFSTPEQIIAWAEEKPLLFPVGTKAQYSNTGYLLLGEIIKKVSGQTLDAFFESRMFKPLGMKTVYGYQLLRVQPNLARGYVFWTKEADPMDPTHSQG